MISGGKTEIVNKLNISIVFLRCIIDRISKLFSFGLKFMCIAVAVFKSAITVPYSLFEFEKLFRSNKL